MEKGTTDPSMVPLVWCCSLRLKAVIEAWAVLEEDAAPDTIALARDDAEGGREGKNTEVLLELLRVPNVAVACRQILTTAGL